MTFLSGRETSFFSSGDKYETAAKGGKPPSAVKKRQIKFYFIHGTSLLLRIQQVFHLLNQVLQEHLLYLVTH